MVFAEEIRKTILKLAEERGPEKTFDTSDVAKRVDRDNWQSLLYQVGFVASVLVKEGKIRATQFGRPLHDPNEEGKYEFQMSLLNK